MSLSRVSVRRPVLMTVMAIGIMLLGFFGIMSLGIREYPNVESPIITVSTTYSGANAAVVESEVTEILEESINSASGIKSITSTSSDEQSRIRVEFEVGSDLETAANDIRDRVSRVQRKLPDAADAPTVNKSDSDSDPILMASLLSDTRPDMEVSEIARNVVKEKLQTIPGISEISIWGEKQPVVRLWLDPVKMQALDVSASEVESAVGKENIELPAGKIEGQTTDLSIRTLGRLEEPKDFLDIAVKTASDGTVIRMKDIAEVHYEPEDPRTGFKRNGKNSITLALLAQPGANHIEIADEFYKRLEDLRRDLPSGITLEQGMDTSIYIRQSIREVAETIIIAFILVLAIIFIFLRDFRTTLIPMVVVPVSVVGSFFILLICGFSINVLTLLAMVLAIGLVVDDAIVIVENIYNRIEAGMSPRQAAVAGTDEIVFAVIATSVVLMAVFIPILSLGGTTGLLFREFVTVMIGTVFLSTVSALTLSPMLCSKFLHKQKKGWFFQKTEPFFVGLNGLYSKILGGFLRVRWLLFPILIALAFIAYYSFTHMSSEMAPQEDSGMFMVDLTLAEGTGLSRSKMIAEAFTDDVIDLMDSSEYKEIQAGVRSAGTAMIRVTLVDDASKRRSQSELAHLTQVRGYEYTDMDVMVMQPQRISSQRGGLPVQFVLQATSLETLKKLVPEFVLAAQRSPVFSVVNSNLTFTKPELHVDILRDKARDAGVSVSDIEDAVELLYSDAAYDEYYKESKQYDVIGAVGLQYRDQADWLGFLTVKNSDGDLLPLENFIETHEEPSVPSRRRYGRFSAATIRAGLAPGKTVGDGIIEMRSIAAKILPNYEGVNTALAGTSKEFEESSSGLYFVFCIALAFIFLVLAGQFESFRSPFVILFTVPLALAGALFVLYLTGQTLNIFSEIALVLLIGLVTKNGILIVEFANQIAARKNCSRVEAAREAAQRRFRPILMTNLSTVLGAVPLILTGTPSRVAMGIAIVGGLTFASLMTLLVVPAAYSYFASRQDRRTKTSSIANVGA